MAASPPFRRALFFVVRAPLNAKRRTLRKIAAEPAKIGVRAKLAAERTARIAPTTLQLDSAGNLRSRLHPQVAGEPINGFEAGDLKEHKDREVLGWLPLPYAEASAAGSPRCARERAPSRRRAPLQR